MPDNVIRIATSNDAPVKRACGTCRHVTKPGTAYQRCKATGFSCHIARTATGPCGFNGLLWEPVPPPPPRIGFVGWIKRLLFGDAK